MFVSIVLRPFMNGINGITNYMSFKNKLGDTELYNRYNRYH